MDSNKEIERFIRKLITIFS